jgi:uncharacterized repeat protein (TIGR02059 family)
MFVNKKPPLIKTPTLMKGIILFVFLTISYLVSATTYYVDYTGGSDLNNGLTTATAWKTVAKVNSSFPSFVPGDMILFKRGETFTGTLTVTKSGISGNPITFGAYGSGADPVLTGFTTLTPWVSEGGNIYSNTVSLASSVYNIVTINGTNTAMGRWPNAGSWNKVQSIAGTTQLTDALNLNSGTNWTGAELVARPDEFRIERVSISGHVGSTLTFASLSEGIIIGNGYFIQNDLRTLDATNEWYYNGTKFYIYGDPSSKIVRVSANTDGIKVNSYGYLTFDHLQLTGYGRNGFDLTNAAHITIQNCNISYCGENAIKGNNNSGGNSTLCVFDNNIIDQINSNGIYLQSQFSDSHISNNSISNIGLITGAAHGSLWDPAHEGICLLSQYSNTNTIVEYNTLNNIGYIGIMIEGTNITARYNFVNNFCLRLNDGGGIYTWSLLADPPNRVNFIRNNIILRGVGNHDMTAHNLYHDARGIYLDDFTKGTTVDGNTVAWCAGANMFIKGGVYCTITNNTIYDDLGADGNVYLSKFSNAEELYDNLRMTNNKFISKDKLEPVLTYLSSYGNLPATATLDNNYYARPIDDNSPIKTILSGVYSDKTLAQWQAYTGKDAATKKSNVTTNDTTGFFKFVYNTTKVNHTIALAVPMIDVDGTKFGSSITLLPYSSAVLMVDPNPVIPTPPVYVSSVINDVSPSLLEMTYNLSLANIVPAPTAFSVQVNSVARSVNSVAVSGTKVTLTLTSPVAFGDIVKVSYIKPATNPLQTAAGGVAASISNQPVTNNVTATLPVYQSSVIQNATPSLLEMTYNLSLANIVPASTAFSVQVNSVARSINSVSVSGTKVTLTLSSPVTFGDIVKVSYTKPATNPLQTIAGGLAASISNQPVTNNVAAAVPVYQGAVIQNGTPSILEITYNLNLANIVPAATAFSVLVNSVPRTVNFVTISGTKVLLTLSSPVVYGNYISVTYTKPSTNPIQTLSGGQAVSYSAQSVTNNVTVPGNQPPTISLSSPSNNSSFVAPATVTISANASDIDGSVAKVEFFNGGAKLGETTTTPYTYVWNNVVSGTYNLTAIATDNLNAKTTSAPIAISVNPASDQPPVISISSPINGSSFISPASIMVDVNASDPDGAISKVAFFNGSTKLGESTTPPYTFTWNNVNAGTYLITAVATDNLNLSTTSLPVQVVVTSSTKRGHIKISNPANGNKFLTSSTINITLDTYDPDSTINRVEYYMGSTKIGESTQVPYSFSVENASSGTFNLKAVACDVLDTVISSSVVSIIVTPFDENSKLVNLYPNPNDGHFSIDILTSLKDEKNTITITDLAGKIMYNDMLYNEEIQKRFDLSNLSSGVYVLIITGVDIALTKKFIKK